MKKKILICDDEKNILILASRILNDAGYETEICLDSNSMIRELAKKKYDLVLTDMYLNNETGISIFKKIKEKLNIPFILFSASSEENLSKKAFDNGFRDFLRKPFGKVDLVTRVQNTINQFEQKQIIENKNEQFNQELCMAAKLQKELSPNWIMKSGNIYSSYVSKAATQMNGDLFGVYQLDKDQSLFVMGDVSGHGVSSAILSIGIRNYISNITQTEGVECLSTLVEDVNKHVCDIYDGQLYMTMVFVLMNSSTLEAEIVSAGHKFIYKKSRSGFKSIGDRIKCGIPLGWDRCATFEEINLFSLSKDEALFICTDGISGEVVDEEKLFDFLNSQINNSFSLKNLEIPFNISKKAFEKKSIGDDLTAVVITPECRKINTHSGVIRDLDDVYELATSLKQKDIGRSLGLIKATSFSLIVSEWAGNLLKYVNDSFDKTIYFEIDYETEKLSFYHQTPPYKLSKIDKPELCTDSGRGGHIINSLADHEVKDCGSGLVVESFFLKKTEVLCG